MFYICAYCVAVAAGVLVKEVMESRKAEE